MKQQVLEIVLTKINDPEVCENQVLIILDEIEFFIKEYCNISDVPKGLMYTWANMAYEKYIKDSAFKFGVVSDNEDVEQDSDPVVKSVSVEGVSVSFVTDQDVKAQNTKDYQAYKNLENIMLDYTYMLDKYRKVNWE